MAVVNSAMSSSLPWASPASPSSHQTARVAALLRVCESIGFLPISEIITH